MKKVVTAIILGSLSACGLTVNSHAQQQIERLYTFLPSGDVLIITDKAAPHCGENSYEAVRTMVHFEENSYGEQLLQQGCWTMNAEFSAVDTWWPDRTFISLSNNSFERVRYQE